MRIQSVEYRRLVSGPGYSNVAVGAMAGLEAGETPEDALTLLKRWVDDQVAERERAEDAREEVAQKTSELSHLNRMVETAKIRWEAAQAFLEKHGVVLDDGMPF